MHLGWHGYHFTYAHELLMDDLPMRHAFAENIMHRYHHDAGFIDRIFWTDEATFTRGGYHNSHNLHYYAPENPHLVRPARFQRNFKVNVWAAVIGDKVIGPHYFHDNLNGQIYSDFLRHELPRLLGRANLNVNDIWFQHDGAPPHYAAVARRAVNEMFHDRWIGRLGAFDRGIAWAPRSPDLTPLDFYLWGVIKDFVYAETINTVEELRNRIDLAFARVRANPDQITNAVRSVPRRLNLILQQDGGYIENLLN